MAHPGPSQPPSPALFFAAANAVQVSAAIKAAIELDVFTAIAEGAATAAAIAEKCGATERGIRILCDFLVIQGFLTKADSHYALTADTAFFLNQHSPAYAGSAIRFLLAQGQLDSIRNLTSSIRDGLRDDSPISSDHPMWVEFARSMAPMVAGCAEEIAAMADPGGPCRVLDIAAGHGLFGIAFAQKNPQARITALDWPHVLEVAWENARHRGVGDRYGVIPGNAFTARFGSDYDVVLLTNILHHFDRQTCETLLLKVHGALKPGGCAVTLEFIPNPDRVSPPLAAAFAMNMLAGTPAGDAYTFAELDSMFLNAGFANNRMLPLARSVEQVVISTR